MAASPKIVVLGSLNIDLVFSVKRLPLPGETLPGRDLLLVPGGKGANQACAAGKLGARTVMVGQVGSDPFGSLLRSSLEAAGVETAGVTVDGATTGAAMVLVIEGGQNAIVISAGANGRFTPERVRPPLECLLPGDYLLLQLEVPLETTAEALSFARERGAVTILDPAPARTLPIGMLSLVDCLTPNQTESAAMIGMAPGGIEDYEQASQAAGLLLALGPKGVVLKLGELGCFVASGNLRTAIPAFQVPAVDTTAAGDAFNAAFAVALAEGSEAFDAARFGCAAAAISVSREGAQTSLATREEVEQFLKER